MWMPPLKVDSNCTGLSGCIRLGTIRIGLVPYRTKLCLSFHQFYSAHNLLIDSPFDQNTLGPTTTTTTTWTYIASWVSQDNEPKYRNKFAFFFYQRFTRVFWRCRYLSSMYHTLRLFIRCVPNRFFIQFFLLIWCIIFDMSSSTSSSSIMPMWLLPL